MLVSGINVRGQSPFGDGANITKRIHIKSEESANHVIFPCMVSPASVRTYLCKKAGDGKTDDLPSPAFIFIMESGAHI